MVTRKGTLLEKNIEKIFKLAGFNTKRNFYINGYETDVYAELGNIKIVIQCKQYEKSQLRVRDVIHEWDSKRKKIQIDKVVVMIFGMDITERDKDLANEFDMVLWGEKEMDEIDNLIMEIPEPQTMLKYLDVRKKIVNEASNQRKPRKYVPWILLILGLFFLGFSPIPAIILLIASLVLFWKFR